MKFSMLTLALFAFAFSMPAEIEKSDFSMPAEIEKPDFSMPAEKEKLDFSMPAEIEKRRVPIQLDHLRPATENTLDCVYYNEVHPHTATGIRLVEEDKCILFQCLNKEFHAWEGNCTDSLGNCHVIGAKWWEVSEGKCFAFVCQKSERIPQPSLLFKGCKDNNGKCHEVNSYWFGKGCLFYKCGENYDPVLLNHGCYKDGHCFPVNSRWKNHSDCGHYECKVEKRFLVSKLLYKGCLAIKGTCRSAGSKWRQESNGECFTYQCDRYGDIVVANEVDSC